MKSDEDLNPNHCSISSLSGTWPGKRQSQIESGQENPPKSPLNKGGLDVYPFNKGELNISPLWKGGVGGILKLKVFHIKIIILDAALT